MKDRSIVGILLVTGLLTLTSCAEERVVKEILRPVRFTTVQTSDGERTRTFSGVATAGLSSNMSFKVSGTVLKKYVESGEKVREGDLLIELDPADYVLQQQEAQASLAQNIAQERSSKADYSRIRALYENRNASKSDLDAARASYESNKANVESARNRVELAKLQVGYTKLYSPMNGLVADVNVEINENVQPGQTVIEVNTQRDIEVEVGIPEAYISEIKKDQRVTINFPTSAKGSYQGKVISISYTSRGASTYPVKVQVDNADDDLLPGMTADVTFELASLARSKGIMVPISSVLEDEQGRHVFVVRPTDNPDIATVHRRDIVIGEMTNEGFIIKNGLSDGEHVVISGVSKIIDGMKVKSTL